MKRLTLKQARTRCHLTQVALAEKTGLDQTTISKLELGKVPNPGIDTVLRLASALDLDPRALRFGVVQTDEAVAS